MILCCGEALIDMIPHTGDEDQVCFTPHPGGAIFNTAIALGRLGAEVGILSGISTDLFGRMLRETLQDSDVYTDYVISSDRPTTLAFVELAEGHASYVFYDENTAARMLEPADLPSIPGAVTALYLGGISLISEPAAETYLALAVREAGRRVIVADPNIRQSLVDDEARYRARLDALIARVDILKVSDEDLDWMIPGAQTLAEKVRLLRRQGPAIVVVTRGADGAIAFFGRDQSVEVPVRKVEVVDTVGAGDTFNAGFLAYLSEQGHLDRPGLRTLDAETLTGALAYGAQVASITVSRAGANPPWVDELDPP